MDEFEEVVDQEVEEEEGPETQGEADSQEEPSEPWMQQGDHWFSNIPEDQRTPEVERAVKGLGASVGTLRERNRQASERVRAMESRLSAIQQWFDQQATATDATQQEEELPDPEENFGHHLLGRMERMEQMNRQLLEANQAGTRAQQEERIITSVVQSTDNQAAAARGRIEDYDDTLRAGIEGFVNRFTMENPSATETEVTAAIQHLVWNQRMTAAQNGMDFGQRIYDIAKMYSGGSRTAVAPGNGRKPAQPKRHLGGPGGGAAGGAFDLSSADGDTIIQRLEALKLKHPNMGMGDLQKLL